MLLTLFTDVGRALAEVPQPAMPRQAGLEGMVLMGAALATALATLWRFVVQPIAKAIKGVHLTYEKVMEYDSRLQTVENRSAQLLNNSGSSLRDAVDRIEIGQHESAVALNSHIENGREELLKIWQNLASRDAVQAAAKTAEMLDAATKDKGIQDERY